MGTRRAPSIRRIAKSVPNAAKGRLLYALLYARVYIIGTRARDSRKNAVKGQPVAASDFLGAHDAVHHGVDGQARNALLVEFLGDILAVGDNCCGAHAERVGNFLVELSQHDAAEHLCLAWGEWCLAASGQRVGRCGPLFGVVGGCVGVRMACGVGVRLFRQTQDGAGELAFALADVECGEIARHTAHFRSVGQDDGMAAMRDEEGGIRCECPCADKEVVEGLLLFRLRQFCHFGEEAHVNGWHHLSDDTCQADGGQSVFFYNCDAHGGTFLVRS